MVSKASEDLPEPDSPVNTASLSRGISTSMFFRLFSRAPLMIIAPWLEALCWRFALITSSISAFPGAAASRTFKARPAAKPGIGRQWVSSEHRKNGNRIPVLCANHQRFVGAMAAAGTPDLSNAKGRHEAGLFLVVSAKRRGLLSAHDLLGKPVPTPLSKCGAGFFRIML